MKFPRTAQQYSVFSKRLQVALLAFSGAVILIVFCIKACAHVDMIGPEGIHNGVHNEQERRDLDNNENKTSEQCGQAMKDVVDRAIRDGESKDRDKDRSDRNKDRGDRGGDRGSKGDSDRSGGGRKK